MAKPKLALIPAAQGTSLYSVLPSSGVGDFNFTRSGSATRINSQGLIETVASGVSRLNYPMIDGVVKGCPHHILEPERRQLVQYSEDFSNSYWTKANTLILSNEVISPDGSLNSDKLYEDTSSSTKLMFKTGISTLGTISVFAKKGDESNRLFQIRRDGGSNSWSWFNLEDGIIENEENGSSRIENYGDGWYRCSFTPTNSNGTIVFGISNGSLSRSVSYTGDGTSGVYIYGAMLEEGSYPTSYIPNYGTGAGVTRSAETANGSGDAATFNSEQGVLMAEISALADDETYRTISISDGTNNNTVRIEYEGSVSNRFRAVYANNGDYSGEITHTFDITQNAKIAYKYAENNLALWINGIKVGFFIDTKTMVSANTFTTLNLSRADLANDFYGNTKQLQYFDTALTDSELEKLTSWVSFTDMAESQLYSIE
jgi:hypothetical protein